MGIRQYGSTGSDAKHVAPYESAVSWLEVELTIIGISVGASSAREMASGSDRHNAEQKIPLAATRIEANCNSCNRDIASRYYVRVDRSPWCFSKHSGKWAIRKTGFVPACGGAAIRYWRWQSPESTFVFVIGVQTGLPLVGPLNL